MLEPSEALTRAHARVKRSAETLRQDLSDLNTAVKAMQPETTSPRRRKPRGGTNATSVDTGRAAA